MKIPRKLKKKIKKHIWLYPLKDGGYKLASPTKTEEDFIAYLNGELHNIMDGVNNKKDKMDIDNEISISDDILKKYVDNIFAEEYRDISYRKLIEAKTNDIMNYYRFINAYNKSKEVDSYVNICCMIVDDIKK